MEIQRTSTTIRITLTTEEAEAVRDDLGAIWASKISAAGDQLHSLLESVTTETDSPTAEQAEACGKCQKPFDPADTRFDGHARHNETPWCLGCVSRCHDSSDAFHACVICGA